jgi:GT2 family glycosyltransferase
MTGNNCSIIILSYNTKRITDQCLRCLKRAIDYSQRVLGNKVEAIVVENGSTDGSLEMIKKKHQWVRLINPRANTGFAKGNNIGISKAKYDFLLLLNSDAFVQKRTIVNSLRFFQKHRHCDLLGCRLKYEDGRFQPSGGYLPTPFRTIWWMLGVDKLPILGKRVKPVHPKKESFFSKNRRLEWIMGAFLFMKREVFEKTGGFDERFFMYMEEVEWCQRMKNLGINICYTPEFSITHLDKASSNFDVKRPIIKEIQGLIYFHKLHYQKSYFTTRLIIRFGCFLRYLTHALVGNNYLSGIYKEACHLI